MPHHQKQPPGGRPSAPVDRNVGPGDACGRPKGKERSRCWEVSGPPGYQVGLPAVPLVGLRAAPSQVCHSGKPETMAAKGQAASLGAATHNILLLQNNAINCTFVSGSCHGPAGQDRRSIEWACIRIPQFPILAPIDAYLFFAIIRQVLLRLALFATIQNLVITCSLRCARRLHANSPRPAAPLDPTAHPLTAWRPDRQPNGCPLYCPLYNVAIPTAGNTMPGSDPPWPDRYPNLPEHRLRDRR
jgi:hypothetical protein